ncbi:meiosis-specific APC/C activator protein AMA1 [Dothidotthia symphoricarpi CBS 119687]|uniref:Meiosis-specific APC/C activator protein AMA1 n=1 Tax=Dothidotthia symphoricarpi CBS 119687 TaxID=1392245 RepID=A0A6A6AHK4_9PLEO|nr:meiosis-specific APC/C activator protein AMA1 [Dothidotthia symphoricarpi CBS 119687]KAF2130733.1 meiosis-specific APC/C activator protein AMA1 [Dothidotthia symphoricarpi CBS 119687]
MNDTGDEASPYSSGYLTPPLSPTKTVSTEGWWSPRTPGSPRKSRSCLFIRDIDNGLDTPFLTPPPSPTKPKFASRLGALSIPEILSAPCDPTSSQSNDDSPIKRQVQNANQSSPSPSPTLARSNIRFSHNADSHSDDQTTTPTDVTGSPIPARDIFAPRKRSHYRSVSDSFSSGLEPNSSSTAFSSDTVAVDIESLISLSTTYADPSVEEPCSPTKLCRLTPRHASSPLRPSQWAARGGLLPSPRRGRTSTPDRFIACRRPPAITRESFELNKPVERLEIEQIVYRGVRPGGDPFSRRLRRTGRLNDELRGLREAHSQIMGRVTTNRRNNNLALRRNSLTLSPRQVSAGAIWNVGGPSAVSNTVSGVSTGRGGMLGSGTNAPLYRSAFLNRADPEAELEAYERRLALALDVDQVDRILQHSPAFTSVQNNGYDGTASHEKHVWRDGAWVMDGVHSLLDAPQLRDDYYCTLLAYSHTAQCLAVGLGNFVHIWSERNGVDTPESLNSVHATSLPEVQHVTSLDFSSAQGGQAILAVGRADGRIALWSPFDSEPRFDATQPKPISCVSWRPTVVQRSSLRDRALTVATEELLIGDEVGHLYFYSIEWPSETQSALFGWHGAMTLLARLTIHTQQICGLAWSVDGELFASGGNDNNCSLFETKKVLRPSGNSDNTASSLDIREGPSGESIYTVTNRSGSVLHLPATIAKYKWTLNAAVKAMAFCPWQRGLIAIGGGSNDRCIHFYHTRSSTCLATIDCAAQVTSLIWSQTRREIAATFGFAQPEHPYRIAVFAWPSCEQVVAVPWWDENRALCAVAYPGGPMSGPDVDESGRARGEDGVWSRRGVEEGCIVVAASDMAIRFHEIWTDKRGSVERGLLGNGTRGLLGGSDILEGLHGVEQEGAVIR